MRPQRVVQARRADEVPVEAEREEAHALVVVRPAKDVAHGVVRLVDEAEDAHAGEEGEDPLRDDLPHEDDREEAPEHARALRAEAAVEVQRLEHVRGHDRRRPVRDGRVDERFLEEAGEGVADELGGEQREDGDARVDLVAVVQVLDGDDLDGSRGSRGGVGHDEGGGVLLDVEGAGVDEAKGSPGGDDLEDVSGKYEERGDAEHTFSHALPTK